jgi:hypothetical protein
MRRTLLIIFVFAASALSSFASASPPPFSSARSVEAFRVGPSWERKTTGRMFHDQKVIAGPRMLTSASSRAMGAELERVYRADWPSLYCAFVARYGVRVRLPDSVVEVLVCPHCGEVQFYRSGKWFRSASVTGELLHLLRKAFPDYPLREKET